jgi:ribulose-5-phosphate 4-epimerase/fuculose-1-phosphate aldolase
MGDETRQARIDLAAALRWAVKFDLHEGIDNHFTYMVPGTDDRFLAHPFGMHWSEIGPDDLIVVDGEGNTVEGEGEIERSSYCIHIPIHQANPAARCVLHTHMPYATALASVEGGRLEIVSQNALRFANRVAYDDTYTGLALEPGEGARLAAQMGNCSVLFMANHGVTVIGENVGRAFDDLYFVERACMVQVLAMSTGRRLRQLEPEIIRHTVQQMVSDATVFPSAHFEALKRMLAREAPEFDA